MRDETFMCRHCGHAVSRHPSGSARNHCPKCLYSLHVDRDFPGDRQSRCEGLMRPIGTDWRKGKGLVIVHECLLCGKKIVNILADDDEITSFMKAMSGENDPHR